jgi:hypothetical protein
VEAEFPGGGTSLLEITVGNDPYPGLFVTQGAHRIDAHGAASRHQRGENRHGGYGRHRHQEADRVVRLDSVELRFVVGCQQQ